MFPAPPLSTLKSLELSDNVLQSNVALVTLLIPTSDSNTSSFSSELPETTSMATHPLDSALTDSAIDFKKAWHILVALLSLSCLARPSKLSSRCSSFLVSPLLVQRLCSVTNWPLSLSDGLHIMSLLLAVTALVESVSCSDGADCSLRTYLINLWCCPVGQLGIVDHDVVELNNMHKQIMQVLCKSVNGVLRQRSCAFAY